MVCVVIQMPAQHLLIERGQLGNVGFLGLACPQTLVQSQPFANDSIGLTVDRVLTVHAPVFDAGPFVLTQPYTVQRGFQAQVALAFVKDCITQFGAGEDLFNLRMAILDVAAQWGFAILQVDGIVFTIAHAECLLAAGFSVEGWHIP